MRKRNRIGLSWALAGLLCLTTAQLKAQEPADSSINAPSSFIGTDSSVANRIVTRFQLSNHFPSAIYAGEADTGLTGAYRQESLLRSNNLYATGATIGQAHKSLNFQPNTTPGFHYKNLPYTAYRRTLEQWPICRVDGVYTMLRYERRNGQENTFDVEHAQQVGNFRYNLAFQTKLSEGIYVNEGVRDINVGLQGIFRSDSSRYGMAISAIYNLFNLHESGGIANDADYLANMKARAITVQTPTAINRYNDFDFQFSHWLHLGNSRDSNRNLLPSKSGYLLHRFQTEGFRSLYSENGFNAELHPSPHFNPNNTSDSVSGRIIHNQIGWTNREPFSPSSSGTTLFLGVSHDFIQTGDTLDRLRSSVMALQSEMEVPLGRAGSWNTRLHYAFSGYNRNDLHVTTGYVLPLFRKRILNDSTGEMEQTLPKGFLRAVLKYDIQEPDYFFRHYTSNYYCWEKNLQKERWLQAEVRLVRKNWHAALRSHTLANYTFLNGERLPVQLSRPVEVLQAEWFLPIRWKGFGADLHGYLQRSSSDSLHLPALVTRNSLFYGFPLFHQAAYLQFGIEAMYFTAYYADGYQPSMQQFYHQNSTLIGNDLYLDAFVNARIEHFHAYFALSNMLSALDGYHPFQFPHYPAKGFGFRLGISWRFYD